MSAEAREDFTDVIGPVAEKHRRRMLCQVHHLRGVLDDFEDATRTLDGDRWSRAAESLGANIVALSIMFGLTRGAAGSAGEG